MEEMMTGATTGPGDRSRSSSSYLTVPGAVGRDSKTGAASGSSAVGGVFRGGRRRSSARVSGEIFVKKAGEKNIE